MEAVSFARHGARLARGVNGLAAWLASKREGQERYHRLTPETGASSERSSGGLDLPGYGSSSYRREVQIGARTSVPEHCRYRKLVHITSA